jgi:hypothetical protein
LLALGDARLRQMAADKAGGAGDEITHFLVLRGKGVFGKCARRA